MAFCWALANELVLLLADELTGNLDFEILNCVFEILIGLVRDMGLVAVIVTYNLDLAVRMDW